MVTISEGAIGIILNALITIFGGVITFAFAWGMMRGRQKEVEQNLAAIDKRLSTLESRVSDGFIASGKVEEKVSLIKETTDRIMERLDKMGSLRT